MASKNTSKSIGVIGAGNFGTAIANLLAEKNKNILLYSRTTKQANLINKTRKSAGQKLAKKIEVVSDIKKIGTDCDIIFPIIPSAHFRSMIRNLSPYLRPYHILIHGTKGFDFIEPKKGQPFTQECIKTMSKVIKEESSVIRIGCISGPNLSSEIADLKPAATVIASHFNEVIQVGQRLLKNDRFLVYGNNDLIGIELCGILKNIIALGAGTIAGLGLGENAKALFISRGLVEMIHIGKKMGGNIKAFFGLAGIGDLIATCTSHLSRNYTVGYRLAKGEKIDEILNSMDEVAEGIRTIDVIKKIARVYKIRTPITESLYKIINNKMTVNEAHTYFMKFPFREEIDFLD